METLCSGVLLMQNTMYEDERDERHDMHETMYSLRAAGCSHNALPARASEIVAGVGESVFHVDMSAPGPVHYATGMSTCNSKASSEGGEIRCAAEPENAIDGVVTQSNTAICNRTALSCKTSGWRATHTCSASGVGSLTA